MRAAKVQASMRIRAVSPEPPQLAPTNSESKETFRQKARSLVPLNGWTCAVKICHDGMLEDTNSFDAPHLINLPKFLFSLNYILIKEIQTFLVKIKLLFLRSLERFISSREINLCRLDTFPTMVANRPVMYNRVPAFGLL